jgi:CheY-like chemotaxis protein/tRNA A-37 threonylcarbamoyl transferase component Bud32
MENVANLDVAGFGQLLMRLGLVSEARLLEAREEVEAGGNDLLALMRVLERKLYLTPWQSDRLLKGYEDGFFLGGYRILYKVASGSFGRVFRADDPATGRVLAIKVLRRRWSEDPKQIEQFLREGRVGMSLKHPNIVEVLAVNQDPASQQYYIVMEFVEGGNLREILAIDKQMAVPKALKIIEDAALGLAYAFSRGVTHRDVKMTNLLLSSTGECKLVDFGLAQLYANVKEKIDRTVDYAGLEKATGVKQGDTRSDIYFLGCILYECLTGRSPLKMTRDRYARMRKDRFESAAPMRPQEVQAPPSVFALVETMMALTPGRRYQTPTQLLEAVRAARADVEGKQTPEQDNGRPAGRSVFIVEKNGTTQEKLRVGFKDRGYRVFMASDPARAVDRFRQQPFDALVIDGGGTGEDGLRAFEDIRAEAGRRHLPLAAVILLTAEQQTLAERVGASGPGVAVLFRPLGFKKLFRTLQGLVAAAPPAPAPLPAAEKGPKPTGT